MKIAIVVHGRFHAFDLTRALLHRGNDVTVFTNYPRRAVAKFGIPGRRVRSFVTHGVLTRAAGKLEPTVGQSLEPVLHPMFSRWALRQLRSEPWDVIHAWSGVAEEIYGDPLVDSSLRLIMRGSAHIRSQAEILNEEQERAGCPINQPSRWMIEREEREYKLADEVVVLSSFAYKSFRAHGIPDSKLWLVPLGAEIGAFRPAAGVIEARRTRILSGAPLRVLYVGGVSWRKGLCDLRELIHQAIGRFQFRFVGPVWDEARAVVSTLPSLAEFRPKKPQSELPPEYAWGDLFIFPTLEDGYAVVLAQASAAGLPILTTPNCCGPDLVHEGRTGWILPIRNASAFFDRLCWCDEHRQELAGMVTSAYQEFRTRDWSDVAADFESVCKSGLASKSLLRRKQISPGRDREGALSSHV
jgi:glycosyltransferase involved in cell wall biosynthesis